FTIQHGWMGSEESHVADLGVGFTGGEFYISEDDFGYNVEARIPLESLGITPTVGELIGLEIQQDDNDGADREHINKWWLEVGDDSWQVPGHWGTAILGGELVVDVENPEVVPVTFNLAQNYPNPFNPSTKITYTVSEPGMVNLTVYNIFGEQVAVLVNDVKGVGEYSTQFNATNLASGVYFYRLEAGNVSLVKKMMLLK
ncbi:MAG: T9SS type A sorting domain-containing protein, partial [bacterium]